MWEQGSITDPPPLHEREVHVWWIQTSTPRSPLRELGDLVPASERSHRSRAEPRKTSDRTVARGVRRVLLGAYVHEPPASLTFYSDPYGKPRLHQKQGEPIQFSPAHLGSSTLIAVARGVDVGVDAAWIPADESAEWLTEGSWLDEATRTAMARLSPGQRTEEAVRSWVELEARAKLDGRGVARMLEESRAAAPGAPASGVVTLLSSHDRHTERKWIGALACSVTPRRVRLLEGD